MGRVSRGFHLLGASWQVLRADRELLVFPVIAMVATALVAALLATAGWASGLFQIEVEPREAYARWLLLGIFYFTAYTISIFFQAALIAAAMIRLEGGDPSLGDGIRKAWERFDKLLGWAAIAATVGLIIGVIQSRGGALGEWIGRIMNFAWSAITFFVVPVLLYEPAGVGGSMKRSARIFRERWGEQFVGNGAIGIAFFLISIPVVFLTYPLFLVSPVLGTVVVVFEFTLLLAVASAVNGIFNATLYKYAVTGRVLGPFAEGDLTSAFVPASRRRLGRRGQPAVLTPRAGTLEQYVRESGLPTTIEEAQRRKEQGDQPTLPGL
ncbi:MAG TPA: DUF6159 family protein [Actinomycetota bacterium]